MGRGTSATTPPQKDATASKTPQLPDDRPTQKECDEAQARLLDVIDKFWDKFGLITPIESINTLLECWLTTPSSDLSLTTNREQLWVVLTLINFLSDLYDKHSVVLYNKKGGVSDV